MMLRSLLAVLSFACPVIGWTEDDIKQVGGYEYEKTIAYYTDLPFEQRSKTPPYKHPKDWIYNTKAGPVEGKINVHLVPHTHDDTGWQVTFDQYFFRNVYYVIDTVVDNLAKDANRKFIYVEVGFFAKWWDQQPEKRKELVRRLVADGQLEFINGGWCMHDEASPDYIAMVDQTTRGHQFLLKNFGETAIPRGTWQVDPFGHSNTQGWLLGAEAGFESVFWGRTDYQDLDARKNVSATGKGFEWIWVGSQSLGDSASIFAGELFGGGNGGYGTWIDYDGTDNQVQDDHMDHDYNVDQVIDQIVQYASKQAGETQTHHQLWACGTDFQYQNAIHWYHNLDKIIHYVNLNGTINMFYSTPSLYVDQKKKADITWEKRYDDVWPLADNAHNYWSGYFTSRPALKRQVRFGTNFLNAARQMEVLGRVSKAKVNTSTPRPSPPVGAGWTDSLEGTIAVATHHDAMSGTERQSVSNDYSQRMAESLNEVEAGISKSLQKLMGTEADMFHCNCNSAAAKDCLNLTMCAYTANQTHFKVITWNPIANEGGSEQIMRIPVTGAHWAVTDASGNPIPAQVIPIDNRTLRIPLLYINYYKLSPEQISKKVAELSNSATHVLIFIARPPPLGYTTYTAVADLEATLTSATVTPVTRVPRKAEPFTVDNGVYQLTFDPNTGMTTSITNMLSKVTTSLAISWGWYNSSTGGCTQNIIPTKSDDGCSGQKSGAYIFRPNTSEAFYPGPQTVPTLHVVEGPVVSEVYQTFSDWATHVVRLVKGQPYVEIEWTAGPIPIDTPWMPAATHSKTRFDKWGKEVIMKYKTGVASNGAFFVDANGREMVRRQYNTRGASYPPLQVNEPVAGNYYPVNTMIAIQNAKKDAKPDAEFVVLTDVTQGGASLADGDLELMVHRRIQQDDSRGVQEPLNETMCGCNDINAAPGHMGENGHEGDGGCECAGLTVRGRHWLVWDTVEKAHASRRHLQEKLNFPPTVVFAGEDLNSKRPSFSGIQSALPKNVKLVTLTNNYADFNDGKFMIRLAHLYSIGEHPTLSLPATVNLTDVFATANLKVINATAMSLTGNQKIEVMDAKKYKWKTVDLAGGKVTAEIEANGKPYEDRPQFCPWGKLAVTLRPAEVRTFLVSFEMKDFADVLV